MFKQKLSKVIVHILLLQLINCHITWIEPRIPLKGRPAPLGSPWPLPQDWRSSDTQFLLHPDHFQITSNADNCDVINEAIKRYQQLSFISTVPPAVLSSASSSSLLRELRIQIEHPDQCLYPQEDEDETYRLEITTTRVPKFDRPNIKETNSVFIQNNNKSNQSPIQSKPKLIPVGRIKSFSVWGALRALETFSQLVHRKAAFSGNGGVQFVVNATLIQDYPAFNHRGFMLDSARHFICKRTILALLDAMAYNKMNILHWHLVDDQSWPLQSYAFPRLHLYGAYSQKHVYSEKVVFEIIEYARFRGIRVVPELDTPGHTNSLQKSYPELLTACYGRRSGSSSDSLRTLLLRSAEAKNLTLEPLVTAGASHNPDLVKDPFKNQEWSPNQQGLISPRKDNDEHISLSASTLYASESTSSSSSAPSSVIRSSSESVLIPKSIESEDEETVQNGTESFGYSPYTPNYPLHSAQELLDPSKNQTYEFLSDLLQEWRKFFVDEYIHLGMNEVYYACWQSNPNVRKFMVSVGLRSMGELQQYYVKKLLQLTRKTGFKYMIWQDPLENAIQVDKQALVQIWKDKNGENGESHRNWQEYARVLAKNGYRMVLSSCWYLNYITYPYPGKDWEVLYECDPLSFTTNTEEQQLMVGGEACLWGEFVDSTNLLNRAWPRASATAERLWLNPKVSDMDSTRFRLDQHRCRMVERGIPASPILNGYCGDYEWDMNN